MGDMSSQDADLSCHNFHHTQSNWYILPLSAESPHISHRTLEINKEQIIYGKYTLCWIIVSAVLRGSGVVGYLQKCKHKSQSTWSNVFMCVGGWCIWLMSLLLICNEILWEKKKNHPYENFRVWRLFYSLCFSPSLTGLKPAKEFLQW